VPALAQRFASSLAERLDDETTDAQGAFLGGGVNVDN